jgi:3-keto-disaccharide hydrolase
MNAHGLRNTPNSPLWSWRRLQRRCLRRVLVIFLLILGTLLAGCRTAAQKEPTEPAHADEADASVMVETATQAHLEVEPAEQTKAEETKAEEALDFRPGKEVSLFDGETLGAWKVTDFGGQGNVHVEDGAIYLEMGSYTTGITWSGPVIRMNYEIMLEAMRVDGTDFFCALTFPVDENPCTLVLGGWGGTLCGLSNIGFYDASENETTTFYSFKNKVWYHVRLRVEPDRIQAWLDGEELVNVETTGKKIDIRPEMDLCQPLGVATWVTTGAVRNIFLTKLPDTVE